MGIFYGLGALWIVLVLAYFIGCLALGGWLASEKGYSVGSWIVLLLLFGVLALIVLVGAPDKKSQVKIEEQNNLLKQQLRISSTSNVLFMEFIPTHRVRLLTNTDGLGVRKKPDPKMDPFTKLPNGVEIQHINTGNDIKFRDKKAPWFEIRTKDGICGWCFSGSLEKI